MPDSSALLLNDQHITYLKLFRRALDYKAQYHSCGLIEGDRVGIMMEPSLDLYASILGALLSKLPYVPMMSSYPVDRLNKIALGSSISALVCHDEREFNNLNLNARVKCIEPEGLGEMITESIEINIDSYLNLETCEQVAYILFTSGSTGEPKGVAVSFKNISSFVTWAGEYFSITRQDRLSGHSEVSFDLSVFDMFVAWSNGACLVPVVSQIDRTLPNNFIRDNKISIWFSVPSVLVGMISMNLLNDKDFESLRWMIFCGEQLSPTNAMLISGVLGKCLIANLYGPTEATVACSAYVLSKDSEYSESGIPIGWKTEGTSIFVWHESKRLAEVGESGEIYISGKQVALGYWENENETCLKFVPDPRSNAVNEKCFKTGDLALVTENGPVFKGRIDSQVKFRGWRIELGDIENNLNLLTEIVECAVIIFNRDSNQDALVAFVKIQKEITANDIVAKLNERLPKYMIPTHIRIINNFPRTQNGKIDRKGLKDLF